MKELQINSTYQEIKASLSQINSFTEDTGPLKDSLYIGLIDNQNLSNAEKLEIFSELIAKGAENINQDDGQNTILHHVLAQIFLNQNNQQSESGSVNNDEYLYVMLDKISYYSKSLQYIRDETNLSPIAKAVEMNNARAAEILLKNGANNNEKYSSDLSHHSLLFEAIKNENLVIVKLLLNTYNILISPEEGKELFYLSLKDPDVKRLFTTSLRLNKDLAEQIGDIKYSSTGSPKLLVPNCP